MSTAMADAPPEPGAPVIMHRLLDAEDVAAVLGVKPSTIAKWSRIGWLPPSVRCGKMIRWTSAAISEFIARGGPAAS